MSKAVVLALVVRVHPWSDPGGLAVEAAASPAVVPAASLAAAPARRGCTATVGVVRVAVVGAGIGGLTAALCLAAAGIGDVTVYERSDELHEIGAGIQLSPNGTRILHRLGLGDALDAVAVRPATGDMRRWEDWSLLSTSPLGDVVVAEYGFPYYHVHRADLHRVLAAGVTPGCLALGRRLVGFDSAGSGVVLRFADGSSATADVVVGADGIHSVVRRELLGAESPRFSGNSAWRGMVPAERVADLQLPVASTVVMGPGRHFVYYFVSAGRYVNWVGVAPSETWTLESWTAPGRLEDALGDFAGWNPVVRRLIAEAADASDRAELYRWALYDRDPLPRWGDGPVTLLGDAAHPMLPFMGQGRLPGDRGRRRARGLPAAATRPGPGAAPLRGPAPRADRPHPTRRPKQRDRLPPPRRPRPARPRPRPRRDERGTHRPSQQLGVRIRRRPSDGNRPCTPRPCPRQRGVTGSDVAAIPRQPARSRFGAAALTRASGGSPCRRRITRTGRVAARRFSGTWVSRATRTVRSERYGEVDLERDDQLRADRPTTPAPLVLWRESSVETETLRPDLSGCDYASWCPKLWGGPIVERGPNRR